MGDNPTVSQVRSLGLIRLQENLALEVFQHTKHPLPPLPDQAWHRESFLPLSGCLQACQNFRNQAGHNLQNRKIWRSTGTLRKTDPRDRAVRID